MVDKKLILSCELTVFLDQNESLESMRVEAENFVQSLNIKNFQSFPSFTHCLLIDVMKLYDHSPELGDWLVQEPFQVQTICANVLYSCLRTVATNTYAEMVNRCQLHVTLRLTAVSTLLVQPNKHHYSGLVCIQGVLVSVTKPTSYISYSVWACPEECEGNEVVLHHLTKRALRCHVCKTILFEKSRLRRCGERVTATLRIDDQILPRHVIVSDDLIQSLSLGMEYTVIGVVMKKYIHAWSLETNVRPVYTPIMPRPIDKLHRLCGGLPWKFTYCLASSLAADVCPMNEFMHLKMTLLLSLASLKSARDGDRSIVHVLAVGESNGYIPKIMADAVKYIKRSVTVGGVNTSMSDALLASSDGVCVLPLPLHAYPQTISHNLLAAIESNEISAGESKTMLRSAVWAHGCDHKKFRVQHPASVFGMFCRGEPSSDESLINFVLQQAIDNTSQHDSSSALELSKYLASVCDSTRTVTIDEDAEDVLRMYFTATRHKNTGVNALTAHSLAALCRASARLCARSSASEKDALLALWLHASASNGTTEFAHTPEKISEFEMVMENFKMWLNSYLTSD